MTDEITEDDFRITYVKWGDYHPVTEENLVEKSNLYLLLENLPKDKAEQIKQQILDGLKLLEIADKVRFNNITLQDYQKALEELEQCRYLLTKESLKSLHLSQENQNLKAEIEECTRKNKGLLNTFSDLEQKIKIEQGRNNQLKELKQRIEELQNRFIDDRLNIPIYSACEYILKQRNDIIINTKDGQQLLKGDKN